MINISFYLLNPNAVSRSQVYISISNSTGRLRFSTGEPFYVSFCKTKGKKGSPNLVRRNASLSLEYTKRLLYIQEELLLIELEYKRSGRAYTLEDVKDSYLEKIGKKKVKEETAFFEVYNQYLQAHAQDWSWSSIKKQRSTFNHLVDFEKEFKVRINLSCLDGELWVKLRNDFFVSKKKFSNPLSNKYLSCFKQFLKWGQKKGYIPKDLPLDD